MGSNSMSSTAAGSEDGRDHGPGHSLLDRGSQAIADLDALGRRFFPWGQLPDEKNGSVALSRAP